MRVWKLRYSDRPVCTSVRAISRSKSVVLCYSYFVLIHALYVLLVLAVLAIIGVVIATIVRVRRHMAKPPDQTTVLRRRDPQ